MARYIDVEPLEKYFQERFNYLFNESETQIGDKVVIDKGIQTGAIIAKEFLDKTRSQPTADVVEVVRCKDCYNSERIDSVLYCNYFNKNVDEDDFCSQGG